MAIVIYDAECGFCRWSLAVLLSAAERGRPCPPDPQVRWARSAAPSALRPLPLGTPEAYRLLADLSAEDRAASWHLILDAETPSSGEAGVPLRLSAGAALAPALELVPGGRIPAALLARVPRLTERGYRWVATHRGLLGRLVPERARPWADRVIASHEAAP
jgi:predicted DCC family thiol-disulfide oxidoreductase YuxK